MANSVTLEVIVEGKNIKVVQKNMDNLAKSTNKTSKATDKLTKTRDSYNRKEKGVAGATANGTKAFSKMQQTIGGGSSGLVAAYATLAANIFAATAAFNALRSASKVEELVKSLERIGVAAGRNLKVLSDKLKEVTNNAISTEQALRSAAVATSAGFSSDQLLRLTSVAKGASIALGRDLSDSLDRLVRGTAKLEPEILDELGIFVRIDDATRAYAVTLNKTAEQLSDFERRQAFLNAAIEKGEKRFKDLADELDTNPYDKLGSSFQNLANNVLNSINKVIVPAVTFLSENLYTLAGTFAVLGTGIARTVAGSFVSGAQGAAAFAQEMGEQNRTLLDNLETTERLPEKYLKLNSKFKDGTANLGDYKKAFSTLDNSIDAHKMQLEGLEKGTRKFSFTVGEKKQRLENVQTTYSNLRKQLVLTTTETANLTKAQGLNAISQGQLLTGFRLGATAVKEYAAGVWLAAKGSGALALANAALKISFFALGTAINFAFSAFLVLLPVIGLVIAFGDQIKQWVEEKFFPEKIIARRTENLIQNLNIIEKTSKHWAKGFASDQEVAAGSAKAAANLIEETITQVGSAAEIDAKGNAERKAKLEEVNAVLRDQDSQLAGMSDSQKKWHNTKYTQLMRERKAAEETRNALLLEGKEFAVTRKAQIGVATAALKKFKEARDDPNSKSIIPNSAILGLSNLNTKLQAGQITFEEWKEGLKEIKKPFATLGAGFDSISSKVSEFSEQQTALAAKVSTPYDALLEKAKEIQAEVSTINDNAKNFSGDVIESARLQKEIASALEGSGFASVEALNNYQTKLETSLETWKAFPEKIKKQETIVKRLQKYAGQDSVILKESLKAQRTLSEEKQNAAQAEIDLINDAIARGDIQAGQADRVKQLEGEINTIKEARRELDTEVQQVAVAQAEEKLKEFQIAQKSANLLRKKARTEAEILKVTREINRIESGDGSVSPQAQLNYFLKEKKQRESILSQEFEAKKTAIGLEYDLLNAQLDLLIERARLDGKELESAKRLRKLYKDGKQAALDGAEAENKLAKKRFELEGVGLKNAAESALGVASTILARQRSAGSMDPLSTVNTIRESASTYATTVSSFRDEETGQLVEGQTEESEKKGIAKAQLQFASDSLSPFIEQLKSLGPEGMVVAAIAEGSLIVADSFQTIGEKGLKSAEGLAAISNMVSAAAGIMAAASQQKIAAIDQEIAAEQKRDGKSKESLGRIAALERKKEIAKKKAFEQNKKMQMAQTVMNTAAAVMGVWSGVKDPYVGPQLATAVSAGIIALGAAQLAIIAGSSYQGGGGGGGGGGVSSVAVGSRKEGTDLATSKSASGELAYFRGEKGTGGPEDFRASSPPGAFMGAKYRAAGGPVAGVVVGEQGPEMFVPQTPGRILPEGEGMQQAPVNANITISALDASGVEDILVNQRGNLIGMLREAANSYGKEFMEEVDGAVYTPQAGGATKY